MKKDPCLLCLIGVCPAPVRRLAFLNEVSSVPLQQALRHQHKAFTAFFAKRARYPRFKSRCSRQCAHYTRSAFAMRGGVLRLAKILAAGQAVTACGADVRQSGTSRVQSAVKQEPGPARAGIPVLRGGE
jgi:putative transposase